ncbi:40S ribosomal protein S30 [Zea mays]|uniref:40S ribosomal protein S30 n=1 Tax=Zea mays TaxID=4577 RepID=A0A3L6F6X5_MAIZE|nr:40S ribosomal protein S30 [Zea mays]
MIYEAGLAEESKLTYVEEQLGDAIVGESEQLQRPLGNPRLKEGKVHGSLARAGKVRGQTPKVAKQDKKKKPRGRAYKRMQYNRRFVTAVVGFGKKRGPNSSEK